MDNPPPNRPPGPTFVFHCPDCGQALEAPASMSGVYIECPACAKVILVPDAPLLQVPDENELVSPPSRPPTVSSKKDTIPINLPPNLGVPAPRQRHIVIRRNKTPEH